jgi:phosphatidylserine/phosphatidylglycerophosphate/cardiolipin synthase-like enzyme
LKYLIHALLAYTLVTEPGQGLTTIYSFVNSAVHTIDITIYELDDPTFEQYLADQAATGVTVRVILDQNLEQRNNQAAYTFLAENGVQVDWANPTYASTHQKTITIDGTKTAILTLNLTPRYYSTDRDFAIIDSDPNDVSAVEATFQADFTNAPITPPLGDDLVWSPNSSSAIIGLINSAQRSLQVENEEMSDTAVLGALAAASQRGVHVQITMTNTGNEYAEEWNQLTAAGADVSLYASTAPLYIHAKVIVADATTAFVGSQNFSTTSLTKNRELGIVTSDAATVASLSTTLTSDFLGGAPWAAKSGCHHSDRPEPFESDAGCREPIALQDASNARHRNVD